MTDFNWEFTKVFTSLLLFLAMGLGSVWLLFIASVWLGVLGGLLLVSFVLSAIIMDRR